MNYYKFFEKKDHLIKKCPNLTPEQKQEVIDWFGSHSSQENQIDWQKIATLTYDDFKKVMGTETKTSKKKKVKMQGLGGLKEGEDYEIAFQTDTEIGVVPLNHEASKLLGSEYIGGG